MKSFVFTSPQKLFRRTAGLLTLLLGVPSVRAEETPAAATVADWALRVQEALAENNLRKAETNARSWVKAEKKSPTAWTALGQVTLADGKPRRALRYFTRALKWAPHHAPAFYGRGQCFEKRGRLDEAANEYKAATLADAAFSDANTALARLHEQSVQPE